MKDVEEDEDGVCISTKAVYLQEKLDSAKDKCYGVSTFELRNRGRHRVIYKILGNQPNNYRLTNSCGIIDHLNVLVVQIRLIESSHFQLNDLFRINCMELDDLETVSSQSAREYWSKLDKRDLKKRRTWEFRLPVQWENEGKEVSQLSQTQQMNLQRTVPTNLSSSNNIIKNNSSSQFAKKIDNIQNSSLFPFGQRRSIDSEMEINPNNLIQTGNLEKENEYKQYYEKLVVKVDEQDKQLFMLNQERKKLEIEWNSLSKKQELLKSSEMDEINKKSANNIKLSSAIIIALLSILVGIYFGN